MRWRERALELRQSLRAQVLAGLLLPLVAIVFVNVSLARGNATRLADILLNRSLYLSASALADRIQVRSGGFDVYVPAFALGALRSDENDIIYYRIGDPDGRLLAGYSDLPKLAAASVGGGPVYAEVVYHGALVRFVSIRQLVFVGGRARGAYVTVGETLREYGTTIRTLTRDAALQQGMLAVIAALLAWLGLRRDLMPLIRLGRLVGKREPGDLAPLPATAVQRELRPLVQSLNDHVARQRQQIEAQRRFVANAAHQLRTPLTLLRMQADFALSERETEKRSEAIRALSATTERITRLAKQLLRLSEAESRSHPSRADAVDLVALAREALEAYAGTALARDIDLGLDVACEAPLLARGDATMLRELVLNLVDNAVRYVRPGAVVTVALAREADACVLRVEDDGPGIAAHERELVFERFYRVLGSDHEGSGLGLAIVREIVETSGGSVRLSQPARGTGLVVEVRLQRFVGAPI